jgi:hypothetical protein
MGARPEKKSPGDSYSRSESAGETTSFAANFLNGIHADKGGRRQCRKGVRTASCRLKGTRSILSEDSSQSSYLGNPDDTVQALALLLKKALELPANSVLFFIVPKNEMVEDAAVIQGLANLRNELKANKRSSRPTSGPLCSWAGPSSCRPSSARTSPCWKTRCPASPRASASSRAWSRSSAPWKASTPPPIGLTGPRTCAGG